MEPDNEFGEPINDIGATPMGMDTAPQLAVIASGPEGQEGRPPTCRVFRKWEQHTILKDLGQVSEFLKEPDSLVWLDVVDPGPNSLDLIAQEFCLHPLAVEDAVTAHERPKIEAFEGYWFLVIHAVTAIESRIEFHELAVFAGHNFLVTVRHSPPYSLDEVEHRWEVHGAQLGIDAGYLLYVILDTIVDGYIPVAEVFQNRVDDLEERLFARNSRGDEVLPEIFEMKKDAQRFRHAVLPMRDILNPIIRGDCQPFVDLGLAYFRDVYDHAVRVIDQLDSLRDLVTSALEIHLSVISNRHNEVAKQLTIIATIFLPLSFLTGFFGQNFSLLVGDIIQPKWTFWVLGVGLELLTAVATIGYFRRRGWF